MSREKASKPFKMQRSRLAGLIDFTFLKPYASLPEFSDFLERSAHFPFACIMVPPFEVRKTRSFFRARGIQQRVGTVISFPLGFDSHPAKLSHIRSAIRDGAAEVDVVHNISLLRSDLSTYQKELREMVQLTHSRSAIIKIILETSVLSEEEIACAAELVARAGADFIKTSTGFFGNPTPDTVRLIHKATKGIAGIKASGGIRTLQDLMAFVEAGATRIGTSSGYDIVLECPP